MAQKNVISDPTYNLLAIMLSKLEGLEAYRKYAKDGKQQVWEQVSNHERQGVMLLVDELERLVQDGKLRGDMNASMQKPKVKGIFEETAKAVQETRREELRDKVSGIRDEETKKLKGILTVEQFRHYEELIGFPGQARRVRVQVELTY